MTNLDEARKLVAKRKAQERLERDKQLEKTNHSTKQLNKIRQQIRKELSCYSGVSTTRGKLSWNRSTLTLRVDKQTFLSVNLHWDDEVCVWDDPDTGRCYNSLPVIRVDKPHKSIDESPTYNDMESFLKAIANDVAGILE